MHIQKKNKVRNTILEVSSRMQRGSLLLQEGSCFIPSFSKAKQKRTCTVSEVDGNKVIAKKLANISACFWNKTFSERPFLKPQFKSPSQVCTVILSKSLMNRFFKVFKCQILLNIFFCVCSHLGNLEKISLSVIKFYCGEDRHAVFAPRCCGSK